MAHEVAITVALFGLYVIFTILRWAYKRKQIHQIFVKYNIPGPKPNFLDGNMTELRSANTPNEVMTRWMNKYGSVYGYFIGEMPYLVVKDLDMLKTILIKDFMNFADRPDMYMESEPLCDTVIALKGQRWKAVRNILTPTFSSSKIKLMSKIMSNRVNTTVEIVEKHAKSGEMFDIYQNFQGLTLDVISDCALAMKVDCQRNLKDPFLVATMKFIRSFHNRAIEYAVKFSFLSPLFLFAMRFLPIGQATSMVMKNVKQQIKHRRQNPNVKKVDLLQLMLEANDPDAINDPSGKQKTQLSDKELAANAYMFLLAGFETTSTALAFTFWHLVQNPDVQEKLYQEIMDACPEGEVTYDVIHKIDYVDQVFNESLRLHPPVTEFTSRTCFRECQVGEYTIPKDVTVQVPVWQIQRDPTWWPEPNQFDPDRFSRDNKSSIENLSFLPFGTGPRNCIGMRFAQLEAKLAIAHLVRKFKFVPCEKTDKELKLVSPALNINPVNGIYLKAILRD